MKILFKSAAIAVAACLFFGPPALQAEEALPSRGPLPFSAYDQNGDGGISEAEFDAVRAQRMQSRAEEGRPMKGAAGAPAFGDFDSDGDGIISPAELQAGQAHRMQNRGGKGGQGMGKGPR